MSLRPPPPGWYPDPAGGPGQRWWDGQRWSADLRLAGAAPPDGFSSPQPPGPIIPARAAWWALVGLLVGEVLGSFLGGLDVVLTGARATGAGPTLVGELGLWAGMLGSCVFVSRRYGAGSLARDFTLGFKRRDLLYGLGAGLVGIVVADVIAALFAGTALAGTNTQILTGEKGNDAGLVVVTVIVALGAPFFEELFFRGLIRTALSARLGPTGAIWAQAALFGLAHFEPSNGLGNVSVIVAIAALGVVLGYTARLAGRLGADMVAHSVFNLVAVVAVVAA